jgi:hypothetical protein
MAVSITPAHNSFIFHFLIPGKIVQVGSKINRHKGKTIHSIEEFHRNAVSIFLQFCGKRVEMPKKPIRVTVARQSDWALLTLGLITVANSAFGHYSRY